MTQEKEMKTLNEGDEYQTDGELVVKREKKKKSREERIKERRTVFWTLFVIMLITLGFWLVPKMGSLFNGKINFFEKKNGNQVTPEKEKSEKKNYIEIIL
jgi:hypothetical protein